MVEIGSTRHFMYIECLISNLKQPDLQASSTVRFDRYPVSQVVGTQDHFVTCGNMP